MIVSIEAFSYKKVEKIASMEKDIAERKSYQVSLLVYLHRLLYCL